MTMNAVPPRSKTANNSCPDNGPAQGSAAPIIRARSLFGRHRELFIEHAGAQYRLRITQNNKLILTK